MLTYLTLIAIITTCCAISANKQISPTKKEKYQPGPKLIDETTRWKTLEGEFKDLSAYKGQPLLVVNVATFCAYTQQYIDFNPLIEKNLANGGQFTILAFPCNQFYLQEPAENHEIMNGIKYVRPGNGWKPHKNLHIYGKLEVNGANQHPLYEFLKDSCPQTVTQIGKREELMYNPIKVNDVTWNFEKFLIDAEGRPRFRFHPTAWSHGQVVQKFIDQLAKEKHGGSLKQVEGEIRKQ
uniref:Glutathione peroxidase n=1 Tax=Meloidogyne enterolobii TaxID=390850 RepID=A0A6V7TLF1_MELEN|nr:unnamed protein product [Meloidogyne enterolobii]